MSGGVEERIVQMVALALVINKRIFKAPQAILMCSSSIEYFSSVIGNKNQATFFRFFFPLNFARK